MAKRVAGQGEVTGAAAQPSVQPAEQSRTVPDSSGLYRVVPILDSTVRGLCARPYPLHPRGCPNFGKQDRCPPAAPLFTAVFDLTRPVYAVVNEFDLGAHRLRMQDKHPGWSERQLDCVLYWQPKARKALQVKVAAALEQLPGYQATRCPEAMGVDITKTLAAAGIVLEWPARHTVRQVALLGWPLAPSAGC